MDVFTVRCSTLGMGRSKIFFVSEHVGACHCAGVLFPESWTWEKKRYLSPTEEAH